MNKTGLDNTALPSSIEADALLADLMSNMIDCADNVADLRAGKTGRLFEGIKVIGYCPTCGKPITERCGKGRQKIFCSHKCRNQYNHQHREERTKTGKVIKNCEYCGKEFIGLNGFSSTKLDSSIMFVVVNSGYSDNEQCYEIELCEGEQEIIYRILDEQCRAYYGKSCAELLEEARQAMEADE